VSLESRIRERFERITGSALSERQAAALARAYPDPAYHDKHLDQLAFKVAKGQAHNPMAVYRASLREDWDAYISPAARAEAERLAREQENSQRVIQETGAALDPETIERNKARIREITGALAGKKGGDNAGC
jgi:hypothetical protein